MTDWADDIAKVYRCMGGDIAYGDCLKLMHKARAKGMREAALLVATAPVEMYLTNIPSPVGGAPEMQKTIIKHIRAAADKIEHDNSYKLREFL